MSRRHRVSAAAADASASHLAEGFAAHVHQWAIGQGADAAGAALARRAAFALSLATQDGHVCLPLEDLDDGDLSAVRRALLGSGVVGTSREPASKPLVLDADNRLYLHRHFDEERRLAARLRHAAAAPPLPLDAAARDQLRALFPKAEAAADSAAESAADSAADTATGIAADAAADTAADSAADTATDTAADTAADTATDTAADVAADTAADSAVDWQQVAVALALRRRLCIVSGGPGTGKTTTVVKLLACLLAQRPQLRIALAAPTGKAAARLAEAVRDRAAGLPREIRAAMPTRATTVHRLLGMAPRSGANDSRQRLPVDLLVIDEASMLDLSLATRLLTALGDGARIVLLGDKDQLAAVESGAVFAEISADPSLSAGCVADLAALCEVSGEALQPAASVGTGALRDSVVWLKHNYRFSAGSTLGRLAADINAARTAQALQRLREPADASLRWLDDGETQPGESLWQAAHDGYAGYFAALHDDAGNVAAIDAAFARFRVLCAVNAGPRGTRALNEALTRHARAVSAAALDAASPWHAGRPVMVLHNDPVLKLFNGDIGIALPDAAAGGELRVFFADPAGGHRAVAIGRLPPHETAFAMSVHKSQGSEFDAILLLLPQAPSRVLTRELLYTAVTRARRHVTLCASSDAVVQAIDSPTRRRSGLLARLAEAFDG